MEVTIGKDAPKAPDPMKTADTQYKYSKKTAQDNLNMNSLNRSGPFGASTFQRDANGNPTGINTSLNAGLQSGANSIIGALGSQAGLLPTSAFNPNVDASGIRSAYQDNAMMAAQPEWARQDKQNEIRLSERGIPIGSEVWRDNANQVGETRNQYMRGAANDSYIAGANEEQRQYGNQLNEYQLPGQMAGQNLGLLNSINGLTPQAQQTTASATAPNYTDLVNNKYNADMANYQNKQSGIGQLVGTGLGLLTAPMTGGLSLGAAGGGLGSSLLGMGARKLFNDGSPQDASNSKFNLNNLY